MRAATSLLTVLLLVAPMRAQQCAGPGQLYGANTANSIGLLAQNGVNPSWISGGIAFWDVCGSDSGFPALFCNQPGDYTVRLAR